MAKVFPNRAWMTTATTGTGPITLGVAQSSYLTFAEAGVANADTADYTILDGANFESGVGTYTTAGTTWSRDTVTVSKIAGVAGTSKISLSGTATVFLTILQAEMPRSGTWTPTMTFNNSSTGVTYSTQVGNYIKISKFVQVWGNITLTSNGSGVGQARITGLPFTVGTIGNASISYWGNFSGIVGAPAGLVINATTEIDLYHGGATAAVGLTDTNITDTATFYFYANYAASA